MTLRRVLALPFLLAMTATGHAADADLLASAPEVQLDASRSGFYLRGDVFYDVAGDLDGTRAIAQGAALAVGPVGGEREEGAAIGLGLGYRFTDMLRADLSVRYGVTNVDANAYAVPGCGTLCLARDGAQARSLDVLATGYLDLGTFAGITPYVGAGLGAVRIDYGDVAGSRCGLGGCAVVGGAGETDWRFAYALGAGIAYDVGKAVTLDLGYRFLDTAGGDAWRIAGGGATSVAVHDDGLTRHSIALGLRFALD